MEFQTLAAPMEAGTRVAFSPDGRLLAATGEKLDPKREAGVGSVAIWDVNGGRLLRLLASETIALYGLAFSPDGRRLAAGGQDKLVREWDVATGRRVRVFDIGGERVYGVAYSPSGRTLAAIGWQGGIALFSTATGATLKRINRYFRGLDLAFSPGGDWFAAAIDRQGRDPEEPARANESGGAVKLLDARSGELIWTMAAPSAAPSASDTVNAIAFSRDGRLLAAASNFALRLWDPRTGRLVKRLSQHPGIGLAFYAVAFSPDGQQAASGQADGTLRLWDVRTGKALVTQKLAATIAALAFAPDGKSLAVGTFDEKAGLRRVLLGRL